MSKESTVRIKHALSSGFNEFVSMLSEFTEAELTKMLTHERAHENRRHYVERIHARYSKLRTARERKEILNE